MAGWLSWFHMDGHFGDKALLYFHIILNLLHHNMNTTV